MVSDEESVFQQWLPQQNSSTSTRLQEFSLVNMRVIHQKRRLQTTAEQNGFMDT